jgi:hypothetical protein
VKENQPHNIRSFPENSICEVAIESKVAFEIGIHVSNSSGQRGGPKKSDEILVIDSFCEPLEIRNRDQTHH